MMLKSPKQKGSRLERQVVSRINQVLGRYGVEAKRTYGSGNTPWWKGDVWLTLPMNIECKNQERINLWDAWEQTEGQTSVGKLPALIISRNFNRDPLAVIKFEDLLFFMELAIQSGWVTSLRKGRVLMK